MFWYCIFSFISQNSEVMYYMPLNIRRILKLWIMICGSFDSGDCRIMHLTLWETFVAASHQSFMAASRRLSDRYTSVVRSFKVLDITDITESAEFAIRKSIKDLELIDSVWDLASLWGQLFKLISIAKTTFFSFFFFGIWALFLFLRFKRTIMLQDLFFEKVNSWFCENPFFLTSKNIP